MSITYYANKVRETSITAGNGNMILSGAPLGFKGFVDSIGAGKELTYHIYRQDTNFEWEIGVGYILSSGGVNQLVRQRVVSSSNSNNFVGFTSGTKFIETVISENRLNTGLLNVEQKSSSFTAPYAPATYILDASSSNITIDLPQVNTQSDPILLSFVLSATSGSIYQQNNAIELNPYGTETINGSSSSEYISILSDCLQLVSVPAATGWIKFDPIQDSTNPYGNDGYIQFKHDGAFSGVNELFWNSNSSSLLIGDSGSATADILLTSQPGQSVIFNQNLYDKDFRIAGTGTSHLLFVDGGSNTIGINSAAPTDALTINANNKSGISIYKSGVGPSIIFNNTTQSGLSTNTIGSIGFNGLSTLNNPVNYAKISASIASSVDGAENSLVNIGIMNNGSYENVAEFNSSGTTLGFNNSNIDGIIIGHASANEGNNIVLGYYNNICGENCSVIGDNIVISSGSFGGAIGSNHAVSGNNIWVIGGEDVSVSGNNSIYLAIDNDNYIAILDSGNATFTTISDSDCTLAMKNKSILSTGINQFFNFNFVNTGGVEKTGLSLYSNINTSVSGQENTTFKAQILYTGVPVNVLSLSGSGLSLGNNNSSINNSTIGFNNNISGTGNSIFGKQISTSGNNNTLIGNNLQCSGSNISIFGRDNLCSNSGNLNIVILGKGNEVNEDNVVSVGIDNSNSGLYSFSFGYMNGVHGDYSVGVGESNIISSNSSVAVGKNNNLSSTSIDGSIFAIGIGNYGQISNTGFVFGYLNEIYGSGAYLIGNNIVSSGNNNIVIGNNTNVSGINNLVIGSNRNINNSGCIDIFSNQTNGILITTTGLFLNSSNAFIFDNNIVANSGLTVLGNITCSGTGVFSNLQANNFSLSSISDASGINTVKDVVYQNNQFKTIGIANSGTFVSPLQLTASDSEYQFLYPTGYDVVYLPNGSGLYMGKKFTIVNMNNTSYPIYVRKSGDVSDLATLNPQYNISIVHAGNNNWIRTAYHAGGYSYVTN